MNWWRKLLTPALCLLFLVLAFRQSAALRLLYPTSSLRYTQPLTDGQVQAARAYTAGTDRPCLTFWGEEKVTVSSVLREAQARAVRFDGEAEIAFPTEYSQGRSPVFGETGVCAVSNGLAWTLFGSGEVEDGEIFLDGETYRIVGVFLEKEAVLLQPGCGGYTAVELDGLPEDPAAGADFAAACGLDDPDNILWGAGVTSLAGLLPFLPLLLATAALVRPLLYLTRNRRSVFLFSGAFFLAMLLPLLLEGLPAWLIPTRWSDFTFWSELWEAVTSRDRELLALRPGVRDVAAKGRMLKLAMVVFAACILSRSAGAACNSDDFAVY